jgi:hypothetical protein
LEFDPRRIGVMALSLGRHYAAPAATLEPRFACCIAWGTHWDYHAALRELLSKHPEISVRGMIEGLVTALTVWSWTFGKLSDEPWERKMSSHQER